MLPIPVLPIPIGNWVLVLATVAIFSHCAAFAAHDIVIYGSSPAAISAAVQAGRMGKSAVIVSPETRIGGLTTGGLGQTDIGNKNAFGGIALEFYRDVAAWYADASHWQYQTPESYSPSGQTAGTMTSDSMWTFEPSAALAILEGWESRDNLDIRRGEWLDRENGVEKSNGRIVSITTLSGNVYRGKVFIDATYEGDLMAAAGVSYTVGREANSLYGETLNGNQPGKATHHQLAAGIDPYRVAGDSTSGLLPNVEDYSDIATGAGDNRVQAYNFRMCLTTTNNAANCIPFAKPEGYDELEYELLFRHYEKNSAAGVPWGNSKMPNGKTDTNNSGGFSTDFIGRNYEWPEASYVRRAEIFQEHLKYQRGLMWTLANHERIPASVRKEVSKWGTCRDEFLDGPGDGWQSQLYVREARRMVGDYVMTEANCRGTIKAGRPVAMAAYTMDSHHVRRYVGSDGYVHNEGDVQVGGFSPYPIDYGSITPKRTECENLLVPVCLSASHIAFGSIRMEPVFFALGQAAGTAASLAATDDVVVQDVSYAALSARLASDGQVIGSTVFETANGDTGEYTFGSPVEDGETAVVNIGGAEKGDNRRFVFRSGTVNVRDGGYVRVAACVSGEKTYGNVVGANGGNVALNIEGGVFWACTGGADLSVNTGAGRVRIGVNDGAGALAQVNLSSGLLKVENVLMCGGSGYNSDKATKYPAELNISGGTAEVDQFWLGAAESGSYSTATLNLAGGELKVRSFLFKPYHNETFNWGSGTVTATAADAFGGESSGGGCTRTVNITGTPAVFDTGGYAQTIPRSVANADGTGTLKLTGGGAVTIPASPSYNLWLDGTTLVVSGGGLVVARGRTLSFAGGASVDGTLSFSDGASLRCDVDALGGVTRATLTASGGFSLPEDVGSVLDLLTIAGADASSYEARLSADGKTIVVQMPGGAVGADGKCRFVAALEEGRPQKIVCYGTSLTALSSNWVSGFQEVLDARWPGLATVVNSGLSGKNSATGLAQVQTKVVSQNPDAVLIEFSMNDAADSLNTGKTPEQALADAEANLKAIIAVITNAYPNCEIILETMNDYVAVPGSGLSNRTGLANHVAMYRRVAEENGYLLVDHWPKWQEVLAKGEAEYLKLVPDGVHPNAEGSALVTLPNLLRALGVIDKWVDETATMKSVTGAWLRSVSYGDNGKAYIFDNAFTPYTASTGNVVTVETTAQFSEDTEDRTPDVTAQAAVRLSTNGCFQVWVGNVANVEMLPVSNTNNQLGTGNNGPGNIGNTGNNPHWVDVVAEGITPVSGAEYTLRTTFDYTRKTYSVEIKNADEWLPFNPIISQSHNSTISQFHNVSSFPLAATADRITSIGFEGDTLFTSLLGNCVRKLKGFVLRFR